MFRSVLIANRGEVALRIQRRLGLRKVLVHSEADSEAPHVRHADQALCIGPATAAQSHLDQPAIPLAATDLPLRRRLVDDAELARGGVSIHHLENRLRRDAGA
jgi:biotin carboxylase